MVMHCLLRTKLICNNIQSYKLSIHIKKLPIILTLIFLRFHYIKSYNITYSTTVFLHFFSR